MKTRIRDSVHKDEMKKKNEAKKKGGGNMKKEEENKLRNENYEGNYQG